VSEEHVRGPDGAPLVVIYADFTCPRCALAWERLRGAPLRVAFRHLALRAKHQRTVALARAAEAAAAQGAFWAFADARFADQGRNDDPHLWAWCEREGLDLERFERDRRDEGLAARVTSDTHTGVRAGVTSTPTLFAPDGAAHPGPPAASLVLEWMHSDPKEMN
jgi:protein-disulfide isomerase